MCGGHQRTLSNRRLPSSQSKPTAVDRQKDYSINYGKCPPPPPPEPPKSNKKENKQKKESVRCLQVVSFKPVVACKHAPAHLSTRQITSVGRPRTSTSSTPHVHTNFSSKLQKVLRSEVTLPPSVNKTIDSRLDRGKHFESNCTCWQSQTAADCEKETISCRSSSTVCTHSNNVVTGDRVGTLWGRHTARSGKSCLPQLISSQFTHKSVPVYIVGKCFVK